MGRQKITKSNQIAEQGKTQSPAHSALSAMASAEHILYLQRTIGNQAVLRLIQTKLKTSQPGDQHEQEADRVAEQSITPTRALIVDDEVKTIGQGQMRKSEFLSQLRTAVCSTAADALSGTIWSAMGCPYIDRWFNHYAKQDSQHVERAIRKYAPETASVKTARQYIPIVTQRVRRGIAQWAKTGEMTGVPEEFVKGGMPGATAAGLMGGLVSGMGRAISGVGRMLFKKREGGAREAGDPQAIQAQLGSGSSLDSGVRSRMESTFGVDFSGVRIHTDARAQALSDSLNARAFTIGGDIAFGSGEYQPDTLIGDALIAHELAHVMQQGGGSTHDATLQKGETEYNSLEEDADVSAVGAMVSVWGWVKRTLSDLGKNSMPHLKSGLRLQRCDDKKAGEEKKEAKEKVKEAEEKREVKEETKKAEEKKEAKEEPKLLKDFAAKFPDAADLIRKSEPAMKLVREAEAGGTKFGGYAEDGPGKRAWPYTVGDTVYISKARADKVVAMSDFLFELNNAIRAPKFAELGKEAAKGTKGKLTAKEYAYKIVELEVEGMLRMGEIWFEMKKTIGKGEKWDKYDSEFFLSEYKQFKEGKKTKEDIIKDVLKRVRHHEPHKGMTVEQHYMEDYKELSGGK